ncbi:MAG: hypothetical protein ABJE47_08550 [bacterium]
MRFFTPRAAILAALPLAAFVACRTPLPATTPTASPSAPVAVPPSARTRYTSGDDLVRAMHARYSATWYNTLTFKQKTSTLLDTTWRVQTWYEAMRVPGRLRIVFDSVNSGNGVLYARDSQYVVTNGRVQRRDAGINPLLLLGFDVYGNPPERTAALLKKEGFDFTRVHTAEFEGRPMIVVGAERGDVKRKQFWVDAERLVFVRIIERTRRDSTKMQDTRFVKYQKEGDAWLAARVEIHTDGKLTFHEDYSDIRTNLVLDDALFDPARWKTAKSWVTP